MEPLHPTDPPRIGGYRLTARLGAGGMGRVYLARTTSGRLLVVKVVHPELAGEEGFRARFAREAEAARRVGGFHTAQVVDADPDADSPWIATAHINGPTLEQAVRADGPLAPPVLHVLATGLTEGLQAIHACGLVHRDLKPANIILAEDGPRIIDFGIARPVDADSMTTRGAVFGTLPYMSPEQTDGSRVGPASDVFSLGTVLAYAATGTGPFSGTTMAETLRRLISPPPDPGDIDPHIRDLITHCWNHDPAQRPTPEQILTRFEHHGLESAWPVTTVVVPPAGTTVRNPSRPTVSESPEGEPAPAPYEPRAGVPTRAEGGDGTDRRGPEDPGSARNPGRTGVLGSIAVMGVFALVVGPAVLDLSQSETSGSEGSEPGPFMVIEHGDSVRSMAFAPDGATLATGEGRTVALWSVDSGERIDVTGDEEWLGSVEFTFDDGTLFLESGETARLWYADTGEETVTLVGHSGSNRPSALGPDGATLVSAHADGSARWWDVATGERIGFTGHGEHGVHPVAFGPDGTTLATGHADGNARLWDVETGEGIADFTGHDGLVKQVVFSPDGTILATGGTDGVVRLWDVGTGERIADFTGQDEPVGSVVFGPDGTTLAITGNSTAQVWDIDTGERIAEFTDHTGSVRSAAFSPDGTTLATGDDRTVRLWSLD
ncbi:serine/threonine protein kinase [Nocardiopsis sp. N85]|uniref:serine/threonine-protein kinase n=1 Tax=Nocardiopsis sp. N85 TaxID=3029400 RepID=UPI00237FAB45|nr:serine/threonine-protein kinase [Nocardiopsis sp. N85]MDE3721352.1 serine/threonine protein kinase [Nocardiopsis sp. N85]